VSVALQHVSDHCKVPIPPETSLEPKCVCSWLVELKALIIFSEVCQSVNKALHYPSVTGTPPESLDCYHNGEEHWENPCIIQPAGCQW
jgi:hypothetical protein